MDELDLQSLLDAQPGYIQPDTGTDYTPDLSWFMNNTDFSGLDSAGLESTEYTPEDLTSLLSQYTPDTSLQDLLNQQPGYYQDYTNDPLKTGELLRQLTGGEALLSSGGSEYVKDQDGNVIGYLDKDGNIQYYADIKGYRTPEEVDAYYSKNPIGSTAQSRLSNLLQKQFAQQLAAKQAYSESGIGKALSGLSMAALLAKTLTGKNQAAQVSARGNQGQFFAPTYQKATAPRTKYASGGGVESRGGLLHLAEQMMNHMMNQKGLLKGSAGGQDDVIDIKAAPGEYVMDADVVSSLGDGSNDEGARKLDQMRVNIRKHKRTGGLASIPPKAKAPEQYLKKGK